MVSNWPSTITAVPHVCDRPPPPVPDRHHQAVLEPIEQPVVVLDDQTRRDALLLAESLLLQVSQEAAALVGRVADTEGVDRLRRDAALGEVFRHCPAARGVAQCLAEIEGRGIVRLEQTVLELALFRRPALELDAGALCELREGLRRRKPLLLFEPGENVSRFATTETLVSTPLLVDMERWRLLVVEWA
jgi:hypothetical protein